jgi:signal transduction histidine kinase
VGLAIVRAFAAQHSATVLLGEGDRGRGTRVSVSFPAAPAA